ncbi:LacI family DNA-binding transcriptional regulator [soil metagenome]
MSTIYDIAREAGVSISAVSLVMNDANTKRVGAVKRKEIHKVAERLGYRPSGLARALSKGSTNILGLVVPMQNPIFFSSFIAEILAGIQSCVMERGYHLMIYSHTTASGRITKGELTQSRYVDGVIVLNTRICSQQDMQDTIEDLQHAGIRFVMTNCYTGQNAINYVGVDDFAVGRAGVEYLLQKGHSRIALISGAARSPMTPQLYSGFKQALKAAGKKIEPGLHLYSEYSPSAIQDKVTEWLTQPARPTAIFCGDDQFAPEVYKAIEKRKLRVPKDVSVIGRGNLPVGNALRPELTTMAIPAFEMGRQAAELLIHLVRSKSDEFRRVILDSKLLERESVTVASVSRI